MATTTTDNIMKKIRVNKITLNIGTGKNEETMKKAKVLLSKLYSGTPVATKTRKRIANWGVRPGLEVGCMVTIRKNTTELLKRLLAAGGNTLAAKKFDQEGNFSFGVPEYIDVPGLSYDPALKIMGFNVAVSLRRPGYRLQYRKIKKGTVGKRQRVSKEEAITFMQQTFQTEVER